jgi:NAD(P)-dependent dehydrogenase (short-subunit alcohol dehydrogenase family)
MPRQASRWTAADMPAQDDRIVVITGANTGVGFETARLFAARGARVVLACRDPQRGRQARDRLAAESPGADPEIVQLDLASLASVRAAAADLRSRYPRLDVLINNAGVMWAPKGETADGFETHFGTNHLGHFALTGLVLDLLLPVPGSRVVVLSSPAHRRGRIDFDDLHYDRSRYGVQAAYGRSKLANLAFAEQLQARLAQAGAPTIAVAAHPGGARTELNRNMPWMFRGKSWGLARPITHPAEIGALSLARAAADPGIKGGTYVGPGGWQELTGYPALLQPSPAALDPELQQRLWEESERLTGVTYHIAAPGSAVDPDRSPLPSDLPATVPHPARSP